MRAIKSPSPRRSSRPAQSDDSRALVRAILRLPSYPRDILLLHRRSGLSYEEIGQHLDMAPEAVQTNLVEALVVLVQEARSIGRGKRAVHRPNASRGVHA